MRKPPKWCSLYLWCVGAAQYFAAPEPDVDPHTNWMEASFEQLSSPLPPWAVRAGARETIYHDPKHTTAAIVTCGGLCPGLNDVVAVSGWAGVVMQEFFHASVSICHLGHLPPSRLRSYYEYQGSMQNMQSPVRHQHASSTGTLLSAGNTGTWNMTLALP